MTPRASPDRLALAPAATEIPLPASDPDDQRELQEIDQKKTEHDSALDQSSAPELECHRARQQAADGQRPGVTEPEQNEQPPDLKPDRERTRPAGVHKQGVEPLLQPRAASDQAPFWASSWRGSAVP